MPLPKDRIVPENSTFFWCYRSLENGLSMSQCEVIRIPFAKQWGLYFQICYINIANFHYIKDAANPSLFGSSIEDHCEKVTARYT